MATLDAIQTEGEITLGADKGYDASEFVERLRKGQVVPHIAHNPGNRRAVFQQAGGSEDHSQSETVFHDCVSSFCLSAS